MRFYSYMEESISYPGTTTLYRRLRRPGRSGRDSLIHMGEGLTIHMVRPGRDSTEVTRSRPGRVRDELSTVGEGLTIHMVRETPKA
nr:hypothetical protein Q903MT_gene4796 [Picea sitchensis]